MHGNTDAPLRVGLVGVTGYTGMELTRLLAGHPDMRLTVATSRGEAGKRLGDIYPFLNKVQGAEARLIEPDPDAVADACDLAFLAVPHTAATEMAAALLERGRKVVDLSADFRLKDAATYERWYKTEHKRPDLLPEAVYGLPELYGPAIAEARLTANPGCYPTCSVLSIYPLLKEGILDPSTIIIDAKSGVSGAGRGAKTDNLFCEVHDSIKAYGVTTHRHTPEIEDQLTYAAGQEIQINFTPHLVPMNRGILVTAYASLKKEYETIKPEEIREIYNRFYQNETFVRVLNEGVCPQTRWVKGSNYVDVNFMIDPRTHRVIMMGAMDNVVKGAAGQAVQNMNLMFGLKETTGLKLVPVFP